MNNDESDFGMGDLGVRFVVFETPRGLFGDSIALILLLDTRSVSAAASRSGG